MLRATVRRVHALGDVSVTIDGMYGSESLIRMPCRFNPAPGDRIFVADVAPSVRVHDWVAWAPLTEIGRVTPPEAHEHPPGQVVGLVDWLKQYETWMGDHQARLDAADQQIAEGKTQIDAARKDLTQAQSDIAAGVREAALERARLDQVETNLEQTARNVTAAGTRIAANEAALTAGQQRLDSAETAVQKAQADLGDGSGLAAKVAGFLTISAMTGVFTKSLTAQDAALLGTTVADTLNVTGMLRGRDAILDGTLDVAQLNVTGSMSAKIILASDINARRGFFTEGLTAQDAALLGTTVAEKLVVTDTFSARVVNAMTAQTKQLVVTDDAILNRATVVQSLVTPELIAQKADIGMLATRMITTGALQTSTAANRGVKIDNAGIRAWDDTGQQTVQINGRSNYLVGEFATAPDKQRVRLRSTGSIAAADFFGSNNTTDHLAIWHQADAGQNTVSKIIAHHDVAQVKGNPGMLLYPFRGEFAFAGRWAQESDTLKFLRIDNSGGLGPGGYVDLTYTYIFPFTSEYTVLMPYLSVETASGRECIAMIMKLTYSTIKIRVVNKSAGDTGAIKIRGIVFNMNDRAYNTYW